MILHALAAACFAFFMIEVAQWQYWFVRKKISKRQGHVYDIRYPLNRKPFACAPCLSAWAGLASGLLNGYGANALEVMFLAGVLGVILSSGMKKYL